MTPGAALVIRISAIVLALLFGPLVGSMVFIDVYPPPRAIGVIGVSVAAVTLGAILQLGLFLAPAATARGGRAILVASVLMLPMVVLCALQLAEFVRTILQKGLAVLSRYPPSDQRLLAVLLVIEGIYGWTFVALWRAYRALAASAA